MTTLRKKEVRAAFGRAGLSKVDDNIVSKCIALGTTLRVSPDQMALCWEAFSLNRQLTTLNEHCFESYRSALRKYADSASGVPDQTVSSHKRSAPPPSVTPPAKRSPHHHHNSQTNNNNNPQATTTTLPNMASSSQQQQRRVSLTPSKPEEVRSTASINNSSSSSKISYEQRKGAGTVVQTYNPHEWAADERPPNSLTQARCVISTEAFSDNNVTQSYRHMNTNVEEKARFLDQQLLHLGEAMKERYGLVGGDDDDDDNDLNGNDALANATEPTVAGLEAVGVPRQEPVTCVGRICNEAHHGKINHTTLLLEGARHESGGARVQLDVSRLKENKTPFSLFPGQIVAVEGLNSSGRTLLARRICEGAAPTPVQTRADQLLKYHHDDDHQGGKPLKLMAVSGPFATPDGLNYQPLWDFMHKVQAESPDVVIMTGPFVDMRQGAMTQGATKVQNEDGTETLLPYESYFAEQISAVLQEFYAADDDSVEIGTQFVLVPSLNDATAEWVYPQAPLADNNTAPAYDLSKELSKIPGADSFVVGTLDLNAVEKTGRGGSKRVHCVSNPCTFKINELVLGVTSLDVLLHLSQSETHANLPTNGRMEFLVQNLMKQQSYYPVFPQLEGANIDLKQMKHFSMPCQPDILIAPSTLQAFCNTALETTLVVNPGFLTKGNSGGFYATIDVHPMKRQVLEEVGSSDVEMSHAVPSRSRVEIKRI